MHAFTYHRPHSLAAALALAREDPGAGRFLAGGTDLFLDLEHGRQRPEHIIDIKAIPGLAGIRPRPPEEGGGLDIGGLTPMADLMEHPLLGANCAALRHAAAYVGGPAIRNRATVGGNLCNASPAADASTPLLALEAEVVIVGGEQEGEGRDTHERDGGGRVMPLADLWQGPGSTTLAPHELLTAVRLPRWERTGSGFSRGMRTAMDIALVNAAAVVQLGGDGKIAAARIALGAVAPVVVRAPAAEAELTGRQPDPALLQRAAELALEAAQPIDDIRASADYRRDLVRTAVRRALTQALIYAAP